MTARTKKGKVADSVLKNLEVSAYRVPTDLPDATRCLGITGFMRAAALCEAAHLPLSAHCGPAEHAHPCAALWPVRHIEYFHDHARIEQMFFDGALAPVAGALAPDLSRAGNGLEFKHKDAARFAV